jgi:hypothetical protein
MTDNRDRSSRSPGGRLTMSFKIAIPSFIGMMEPANGVGEGRLRP